MKKQHLKKNENGILKSDETSLGLIPRSRTQELMKS